MQVREELLHRDPMLQRADDDAQAGGGRGRAAGGVARLLQLLDMAAGAAQVRVEVCRLLAKLAEFPDTSHALHYRGKVKATLVQLLTTDGDVHVQEAAIAPLAKLCETEREVERATMERLVAALVVHAGAACGDGEVYAVQVSEAVLRCLSHLTTLQANKLMAIETGAVPALVPFLQARGTDLQRLALGVLCFITAALPGKEAAIESSDVLDALVFTVGDTDTPVPTEVNATNCIRSVIENPAGLLACGTRLLADPQLAGLIMGKASLSRVIDHLLAGDDERGHINAIAALHLLCTGGDAADDHDDDDGALEEGREAALNCLEVIDRCADVLKALEHNAEVNIKATQSLFALAEMNADLREQLMARLAKDDHLRAAIAYSSCAPLQQLAGIKELPTSAQRAERVQQLREEHSARVSRRSQSGADLFAM